MNLTSGIDTKTVFVAALLFLVITVSSAVGVAVMYFKLWPYEQIMVIGDYSRNLVKYGAWVPNNLVVVAPTRSSRNRVEIHDRSAMMPGYRVVLGWNFENNQHTVWLYDEHADLAHQWQFTANAIVGEGSHSGPGKAHALAVLKDGSIVVNLEDKLIARLDACSNPKWAKFDAYHHSVDQADDGTLWTWRGDGSHQNHYQYMTNLDAQTGDVVLELNLVDDFLKKSPDLEQIFRLPSDFTFLQSSDKSPMSDIFHANDVEALSADRAQKYPDFRAGDLLISLKNIDLVAVLDPKAKEVRWWMHGPWIAQHDPDFGLDGRISVFNNNMGRSLSNIVFVDPSTKTVNFSPSEVSTEFYTEAMGKHQILPNENILITVPHEGRVLEIKQSGELVFEFNNTFTESLNVTVANAVLLPNYYFTEVPSCDR